MLYWALVAVPAGVTSVLFAAIPLWTVFITSAAGYERLSARSIVGAFVAIGGLAVIFGDQRTAAVPLDRAGAVFISALTGAATAVIGTAIGVPLLLATSLVVGERWALPELAPTWLAFAYLVFSTSVSFVILTYLVIRWTPTAAAYGAVLGPIVTVALATVLAGEVFGPRFFLGALIVGIGVYIGALAGTACPAPKPAVTAAH